VTAQDAYNYAASKAFADQQLCMVLKLSGRLDENVFAKAVRVTLDQEPVLGCRLVENSGNPVWERRSDLDQIKFCSVVETGSPEQALHDFINKPVHADVDPLIMTGIFREENEDTICVKVNHSACDAGGVKEYVGILAKVYNALCTNRQFSSQPNLGRRDQSQVFEQIKDDLRSRVLKEFPRPTWTFPQKTGSEPLHSFSVIPQAQFEAIKKYAQDKKATVNDVLLTALYRTFFVLNNTADGIPMIHQVSIDLRRYCIGRKAEAICNLSGALYVALERKHDESFEETLERVVTVMNRFKQDYPGIESAAGLEYLFSQGYVKLEKYLVESAELCKKYNVTFPLLSNFGIINEHRFGDLYMTKGYITSPIMYPPGFMLGVSTFNEEMAFSIGYCGQENTKQVNAFLEELIAELPKYQH
jgi:NRPS condensation-like uncharacterized protein